MKTKTNTHTWRSLFSRMARIGLFSAALNSFLYLQTFAQMAVGTNLSDIGYGSSDWVFVDAFKMSDGWWLTRSVGGNEWTANRGDEVPRDADGWPLYVPFTASDNKQYFVHTIVPMYTSGTYKLILQGTGTIHIWGGAGTRDFTLTGGPRTIDLAVSTTWDRLYLEIRTSSSSDPIKNIKLIMPGFADNYETQIFHPLFLERLNKFKNLRFMDWGKINGSNLSTWAQRTTPNTFSQARSEGVAIEHMIQLCNKLNVDMWFCVPHKADNNYITQAARLIRNNLNSNLKVYLEYSNETWNYAGPFTQTQYCQSEGLRLGYDTDAFWALHKFHVKRSTDMWKIFQDEFGGKSRLYFVMASQSAWTDGPSSARFYALEQSAYNPNNLKADFLATAPYFGGLWSADDVCNGSCVPTLDNLVTTRSYEAINTAKNEIIASKALANQKGVGLIAYEGGQHFVGYLGGENVDALTNRLIEASRDPRMGTRYTEYMNMMRDNGMQMFCNFQYITTWSKWGTWGILERQDSPLATAYKYNAVMNWIDNNPTSGGGGGGGGSTYTTIPATIQAEAYSAMSGIQTETTSDVGGGQNVGYMEPNDWMDYNISAPSAGTYNLALRIASPNTGTQVSVRSGSTTLATVNVPNTGGWQSFQTVTVNVNLASGNQTIRLTNAGSATGYLWNLNWIQFSTVSTGGGGSYTTIPATIQAEAYTAMSGVQLETTTDVGGGQNVGWIDANDWMDYNINVPTAGSYTLNLRVASLNGGGQVAVRNGSTTLATVNVPNTAGWQTFQTVSTTVNLSAGNQTIRLLANTGGFNINWLQFANSATTNLTVRARGIGTGVNLTVEVIDAAVATGGTVQQTQTASNISTSFTDYNFSLSGNIPANRIRVRFANDNNNDMEVDYITVGSTTYQTESTATYSVGNWNAGSNGCSNAGYFQVILLHCNGYFHYNIGSGATREGAEEASESGVAAVTLYPNPATSEFYVSTDGDATVELINPQGAVLKSGHVVDGVPTVFSTKDISSGIYIVKIIQNGNSTFKKLVVE